MAVRRGIVNAIKGNSLDVLYADSGLGGIPISPPLLGGNTSGYHAMPNAGDGVAVHYESAMYPIASTSYLTSSALDYPATAGITLAAGESAQIHADGRIVGYLSNMTGSVLFSTPTGTSITIDTAGNISLQTAGTISASCSVFHITAAGGLMVNGVGVTVP